MITSYFFICYEQILLGNSLELSSVFLVKEIKPFEEVENNTISLEEMKKDYGDWIRTVKESYFKLSDTDTAPVERIRWAEAILDLAGWVTNMALFMEREEAADKPGETWMVKHAIRRYRQSMEELRRIMAVMK